jgi:hypothetical protein
VLRTELGIFTVERHGEGRKYWGVTYPDGTYTRNALTQSEAKEQAEAWEPDPTLVPLVELDRQPDLTRELVERAIAAAEPFKPSGRSYYSVFSLTDSHRRALGALVELKKLRDAVQLAIVEQVAIARTDSSPSYYTKTAATWEQVGEALGITKQAASGRYGVKAS